MLRGLASKLTYAGAAAGRLRGARRFAGDTNLEKLRNFGISAHIDSGKTTLTERILYYTGRINKIHEVKGKDGVGATMDSMAQERERGITIKSAATFTQWKDYWFNIIDTPGHVDFTVEVERALRVLDGAILVVCGVGGVQSQTITVDRQMRRYNVPRVCFINKLDRKEAKAVQTTVKDLNQRLGLQGALVQIPIGYGSSAHGVEGVVDLIRMKKLTFEGDMGRDVVESEVPAEMLDEAKEARQVLIERLADLDETVGDRFLSEEEPTEDEINSAIRKATIARDFVPVFVGTAKGNVGVQPVLDGVGKYLPNPGEVKNTGIVVEGGEEKQVELYSDPKKDLVVMAFKLEVNGGKTLSYCRVYQGTLRKGDTVRVAPRGSANWKEAVTAKVTRLARMHSNKMEDVASIPAGEICAIEGVACSSGDTLINANQRTLVSCESMFVPEPVISLQVFPKDVTRLQDLLNLLKRFEREDPTFRTQVDPETKDLTVSGMGELHLEIYLDRIRTEFGIDNYSGQPFVQFREYLGATHDFDHRHKKQSGGRGQFAQLSGRLELKEDAVMSSKDTGAKNEFKNELIGSDLPENFQKSIIKAFNEVCEAGPLLGAPVWGLRFILQGGQIHEVDSSDFAFNIATKDMLTNAFEEKQGTLLEPVMFTEVTVPSEYTSDVLGSLTQRQADVKETHAGMVDTTIEADVPLRQMFGFVSELRGATKGMGEFSMEYSHHTEVPHYEATEIIKKRRAEMLKRK
eukprot:Hpha_TRINITY_DN16499_c0_g2::TRINITY_DN16499_c0_g2_i1::g.159281::m.159281/K02355/fusA, GFM, EFG; elongation factor G